MWLIKKLKDLWSWINFIWHIVGWFGLAAVATGLGVTVLSAVGAVIKGLPWPFVLMAAFCTLVATAYLAVFPAIYKALRAVAESAERDATKSLPKRIPPHYEAWKHVEKFTLAQAAYLWENLDPNTEDEPTEVPAWVAAFCSAIQEGKLQFEPKLITQIHTNSRARDQTIASQKAHPDSTTEVTRASLVNFARKNSYKPKFLEGDL